MDVPEAVWQGNFNIFGIEVKCYELSNGQKVVEADSMNRLVKIMSFARPYSNNDAIEMARFVAWKKT